MKRKNFFFVYLDMYTAKQQKRIEQLAKTQQTQTILEQMKTKIVENMKR